MSEYLIPDGEVRYEQEIKRSRFIAHIKHIDSPEQARQWFAAVSNEFPDARHICWAYIAGHPNTTLQSMSDDGEPSGTAGKPILNVLQHSGAGEIAAAVVRYFGGVKLGTGGLVRAYSSSAVEALKLTSLVPKIQQAMVNVEFDFAEENNFRYLLDQVGGKIESLTYANKVSVTCRVPKNLMASFLEKLPHQIEQIRI